MTEVERNKNTKMGVRVRGRPKGQSKERLPAYVLPETADYIAREAIRENVSLGEIIDRIVARLVETPSS